MFTNVMWATDGSAAADRALEYATALAQRDGATLHVAHVVEEFVGGRVAGKTVRLDEAEITGRLTRQAGALAEQGIDVRVHVIAGWSGPPAERLVERAAEAGVDLIVLSTRGHSPLVGAIVGSVTQRLLHLAECPVLAVPAARPVTSPAGAAERDAAASTR